MGDHNFSRLVETNPWRPTPGKLYVMQFSRRMYLEPNSRGSLLTAHRLGVAEERDVVLVTEVQGQGVLSEGYWWTRIIHKNVAGWIVTRNETIEQGFLLEPVLLEYPPE